MSALVESLLREIRRQCVDLFARQHVPPTHTRLHPADTELLEREFARKGYGPWPRRILGTTVIDDAALTEGPIVEARIRRGEYLEIRTTTGWEVRHDPH
jgi:hypothetical protein